MEWKINILKHGAKCVTVNGGFDLFSDWGMLAQQYPVVWAEGLAYLRMSTDAGVWYISEPIEVN